MGGVASPASGKVPRPAFYPLRSGDGINDGGEPEPRRENIVNCHRGGFGLRHDSYTRQSALNVPFAQPAYALYFGWVVVTEDIDVRILGDEPIEPRRHLASLASCVEHVGNEPIRSAHEIPISKLGGGTQRRIEGCIGVAIVLFDK